MLLVIFWEISLTKAKLTPPHKFAGYTKFLSLTENYRILLEYRDFYLLKCEQGWPHLFKFKSHIKSSLPFFAENSSFFNFKRILDVKGNNNVILCRISYNPQSLHFLHFSRFPLSSISNQKSQISFVPQKENEKKMQKKKFENLF